MSGIAPSGATCPAIRYEGIMSEIDRMSQRHLEEALRDYQADLDFCQEQLQDDLSPSEVRTVKFRIIDLGHSIRHCRQHLELIQHHNHKQEPNDNAGAPATSVALNGSRYQAIKVETEPAPSLATNGSSSKAVKVEAEAVPSADNPMTELTRTGYWACQFCNGTKNSKHKMSGAFRSDTKRQPLHDIAAMIRHFTAIHREQTAQDRCIELGEALAANPGPWEYYIRFTRGVNLETQPGLPKALIDELLAGKMPVALRGFSTAAANFPKQS